MSVSFSVLISIYKNENPAWFREALDSVFAQTVQASEIVLVKDGPLTPELDAVIDEYTARYPIFKLVVNEKNLGLGLALQKGVLACSNEIIVRMDTDDTMPVDRFEKQIAKISEGYDVVSCWTKILNSDMTETIAIKQRPESHDEIVKLAKRRSPMSHPGCCFRKSAVLKAGNYEHCLLYEDYLLWVKMIQCGANFYNIQEVLYHLRTSKEQLKRRTGFKYLINELNVFATFYRMNFYSLKDLAINSVIRVFARLTPSFFRGYLFKWIWNHKS